MAKQVLHIKRFSKVVTSLRCHRLCVTWDSNWHNDARCSPELGTHPNAGCSRLCCVCGLSACTLQTIKQTQTLFSMSCLLQAGAAAATAPQLVVPPYGDALLNGKYEVLETIAEGPYGGCPRLTPWHTMYGCFHDVHFAV